MTDALLDLTPLWVGIGELVGKWGGYLAVILGVYLGLFVLGLIVEAVRSSKSRG